MKYKTIGENNFLYGLQNTVARNRNLDTIEDILSVSKDDLLSPFLLDNMKEAVEELTKAMMQNQYIHLIVDSDVDGYSGSALMYRYLTKGYDKNRITWNVHGNKEHGIVLEELEEFNYDVLIVIDAGSNDIEQHKYLADRGILVIVIDHHTATKVDSPAIIINPQLDKYPNKMLSGVAVAYKFCQAIDMITGFTYLEGLEDYVSMGLIADIIDTRPRETRFLIKQGLENSKSTILSSFLKVFDKVNTLDLSSIGYYFAPLVNAVTRIGSKSDKTSLFRAFIDEGELVQDKMQGGFMRTYKPYTDVVLTKMRSVKELQDTIRNTLIEQCEEDIESQKNIPFFIHVFDDFSQKPFSGLVAGIIAEKEKKPAFIFFKKEDGSLWGSGRNFERFEIRDLKSYITQPTFSSYIHNIGGHEDAFGISFKSIESMTEYFGQLELYMDGIVAEDIFMVDFVIPSEHLKKQMVIDIATLDPHYGYGFKKPSVVIEGIQITPKDITINKAKTVLKFNIGNTDVTAVTFKNVSETYTKLTEQGGVTLNVVGSFNVNEFAGKKNFQIYLDDFDIVCYNKDKAQEKKLIW